MPTPCLFLSTGEGSLCFPDHLSLVLKVTIPLLINKVQHLILNQSSRLTRSLVKMLGHYCHYTETMPKFTSESGSTTIKKQFDLGDRIPK